MDESLVAPTVKSMDMHSNANQTDTFESRQKQLYIYQGPAPPSYWDSPISASQLIVGCALLFILCMIYYYSNFDKEDYDNAYLRAAPGNTLKSVVVKPSEGNASKRSDFSQFDSRLKKLEKANFSETLHTELMEMRTQLDQMASSINSGQGPSTKFYSKSKSSDV